MATVKSLEALVEHLTERLERLEEQHQRLYEDSGLAEKDRAQVRRERFRDFYMAQGLSHNEAQQRAGRDVRNDFSFDTVVARLEHEQEEAERKKERQREEQARADKEKAETQRVTDTRHCAHCLRRMYNLGGFKDQQKLDADGLRAYAKAVLEFPEEIVIGALDLATDGQVSLEDIKEFL